MKFSELIKPELDFILENANFTEEEEEIFTEWEVFTGTIKSGNKKGNQENYLE